MSKSEYITVEENNVDIREWRLWLSNDEFGARTSQMSQDLQRATLMLKYMDAEGAGSSSMADNKSRKLGVMRRIEDNED